jgi:hypothetical protein
MFLSAIDGAMQFLVLIEDREKWLFPNWEAVEIPRTFFEPSPEIRLELLAACTGNQVDYPKQKNAHHLAH